MATKKKTKKRARRTAAQAMEADAFIRSAPMQSSSKKQASKKVSKPVQKAIDRVNVSWRIDPALLTRVRKHIAGKAMESGERVLVQDVFEGALEEYLLRH
jgi:hypothetical protein